MVQWRVGFPLDDLSFLRSWEKGPRVGKYVCVSKESVRVGSVMKVGPFRRRNWNRTGTVSSRIPGPGQLTRRVVGRDPGGDKWEPESRFTGPFPVL